jgi:hypothetical protein
MGGWRAGIGLSAATGIASLCALLHSAIAISGESLLAGVLLAGFAYRMYARAIAAKRAAAPSS